MVVACLHLAVLPLSDGVYAPEAGVLRGFHARTAVAGRFMAIVPLRQHERLFDGLDRHGYQRLHQVVQRFLQG